MSEIFEKFVTDGKNFRVVPGVRLMEGQKVGVDQFTLVLPAESLGDVNWFYKFDSMLGDSEIQVREKSSMLVDFAAEKLLIGTGLKLGDKRFERGINQYKYAREIGTAAGLIAAGGNNKTVMFSFTGHGAAVADPLWPTAVYATAEKYKAHLTRIDLAFDDFDGRLYGVQKMAAMVDDGIFQRSNSSPKFSQAGDWLKLDPKNKGLTLYVGDRHSKMARIYEKGKEQGDTTSNWVRFEVEMHSSCYQLVNEMLIRPTNFFAAMYPCCEWIQNCGDMETLRLKQKTGLNSIDGIGDWLRTQTGHYLHQLRPHLGDKLLLDWICREGKPVNAIQALELLSPSELADLIKGFVAETKGIRYEV